MFISSFITMGLASALLASAQPVSPRDHKMAHLDEVHRSSIEFPVRNPESIDNRFIEDPGRIDARFINAPLGDPGIIGIRSYDLSGMRQDPGGIDARSRNLNNAKNDAPVVNDRSIDNEIRDPGSIDH